MLPPELLVHVVQQLDHPLERWQTAATMAMAGAFGRQWKDQLLGMWAAEAHALGGDATTGPYCTVDELKAAAHVAGYSTRGLKKADLLAIVPQTVPPCLLPAARDALRDRRAARDVDAYLDSAVNEGERVTATEAKKTYCLTDEDLDGLVYEPRRNPHYRSGPPMRLYEVRDVVVAAYEKHKGTAGLAAAQAASQRRRDVRAARREARLEAQRQARREALLAAMAQAGLSVALDHPRAVAFVHNGSCGDLLYSDDPTRVVAFLEREHALRTALAERGLELRDDSRLCYNYVHRGWGTIPEIVDTMDEMRFYHAHTNYATYRQEIYRKRRHLGAREISARAKERAWRATLKDRSVEWLLEHAPPSLRRRLHPGCV